MQASDCALWLKFQLPKLKNDEMRSWKSQRKLKCGAPFFEGFYMFYMFNSNYHTQPWVQLSIPISFWAENRSFETCWLDIWNIKNSTLLLTGRTKAKQAQFRLINYDPIEAELAQFSPFVLMFCKYSSLLRKFVLTNSMRPLLGESSSLLWDGEFLNLNYVKALDLIPPIQRFTRR